MTPLLALALKAAVVLVLAVVCALAGSPLVRLVLYLADRPPRASKAATADGEPPRSPGIRAASAQLRGGRWIGMLERIAIFATILSGFGEGIAIVLAIKGLARYPDLKATTAGAAERFIIGTFTSVLFAAGCAGLAMWLTSLW